VAELVTALQIPPLGKYGVKREHAAELSEKAAQASSMKPNPISLTREELVQILGQAL
jgi:alcohol dehydrogenase class IV